MTEQSSEDAASMIGIREETYERNGCICIEMVRRNIKKISTKLRLQTKISIHYKASNAAWV